MKKQNDELFTRAIKYCELGFSLIPIGKDKKPLIPWKKYQTERAGLDQIQQWFEQFPDMGIAAVTGKISGIVVVDIENGGNADGYPATVTARSGGNGIHLYYRYPDKHVPNGVRVATLTDIRGDGGYIVLPPSMHESGSRYEWLIPPDTTKFAPLPSSVFSMATNETGKLVALPDADKIPEGMRNNTAAQIIGKTLHFLPSSLWEALAWPGFIAWNQTQCATPLDERELRSIFDSIAKRESMRKSDVHTTDFSQLQPLSLATLYGEKFPEAKWLVEGLIPLGGITAVTGMSRSYKTFLMQSLAGSVVAGTPFLDYFPTIKGKVLIIDEENHRRLIRDRFEEIGIAPTDDILFLSQKGIRLDDERCVEYLCALLEREKPVLVILDSLVRFHRGDENTSKDMSLLFSAMRKFVNENIAVLFIHHHRKQYGNERSSAGQNIRGSSDILAAVDCHLSIERKEADNTVKITQTKLRSQKELPCFTALLAPKAIGRLGFTYQGVDNSNAEEMLAIQKTVKDILGKSQEPIAIDALAKTAGITSSKIRIAMRELTNSGEITIEKGAHNKHYYVLGDKDEEINEQEEGEIPDEIFS